MEIFGLAAHSWKSFD